MFVAVALSCVFLSVSPTACVVPTGGQCRTAPAQRLEAVGAPSAEDTLGRGTWLIDDENDEVLLVTPFGSSRRFRVGRWPQQLVVESSGRVFVSCRQEGRVDIIDPDFK